jgi:hypothetical protein
MWHYNEHTFLSRICGSHGGDYEDSHLHTFVKSDHHNKDSREKQNIQMSI